VTDISSVFPLQILIDRVFLTEAWILMIEEDNNWCMYST